MQFHAKRGALFETFFVTELLKYRYNAGKPSNLFFWRDSKGLEVDILIDNGNRLTPVEIKSGQTVASDFFDSLKHWASIADQPDAPAWLIYGGSRKFKQGPVLITPWSDLDAVLQR